MMTTDAAGPRPEAALAPERLPTISGYHRLHPVGEGGSAAVYRSETADGSLVAIKVLRNPGTAGLARRFDREVSVMESVAGVAGVVPLLDTATTDDGAPCLVLPYYTNGSLAEVMERTGPLDPDVARALVLHVARTLARVHRRGVYHRDLKPANVLLDEAGLPWVGDFGVAQQDDHHTVSTTVSYTLGYCPPEAVLFGRRNSDGAAVDVYALAATLWALIAGRAPFSDLVESGDQATDSAAAQLAALDRPSPQTPDDLAEAITAATDPDPNRRPTMASFVDRLRGPIDETVPDRGHSADRPDPSSDPARTISRTGDEATSRVADDPKGRDRLRARTLLAVVVAGVVAAAAWFVVRPTPHPWVLVAAGGSTPTYHVVVPGEAPTDANRLAIDADWVAPVVSDVDPEVTGGSTIFAVFGRGDVESLAVIDVTTATVDVISDSRLEQAWAFADRAILAERTADGVRCVAVDPTGVRRQLGTGSACRPGPEGSFVAITSSGGAGGRITVVRSEDGTTVARAQGLDADQHPGWGSFSPDGASFAVRGADAVISVFDLTSATEIDRLSVRPEDARCGNCLMWNATGALLVVDSTAGDVEIWRRNADPVVLDGYVAATFRDAGSDDVLLRSEDEEISMLDVDRRIQEVRNGGNWIVVEAPSAPLATVTGALLVDGDQVLEVDARGGTTTVVELSGPVVGGSPYQAIRVGDVVAATFEVEGGRDVVALGSGTSARWRGVGLVEPVDLVRLGDGVIATATGGDDGADVLLLVDPAGITTVDVTEELGATAGFGPHIYFTRFDQGIWVDRIDRRTGELDSVLRGAEVVAFGTARR